MVPSELYEAMHSALGLSLKKDVIENGLDAVLLRHANKDEFPFKDVAVQWMLRHKAALKCGQILDEQPHWLFPDAQILEQSTDDRLAFERFKNVTVASVIDLTAGLGVDAYALSKRCQSLILVEKDPRRAEYLRWNFKRVKHATVVCDAAENIDGLDAFDLVFIDPDRRDKGRRTFLLEDATPDLTEILPKINEERAEVWLKLSPMLDIQSLQSIFPQATVSVWSIRDDVKEIALRINQHKRPVVANNLDANHVWQTWTSTEQGTEVMADKVGIYLYYPMASVRKLQPWGILCMQYGLSMLDKHTHVFTSDQYIADFPGKIWKTLEVVKPGTKDVILPEGMHVMRKNYPQTVAEIRKRYKIKEGQRLLLACKVAGKKCWIVGVNS